MSESTLNRNEEIRQIHHDYASFYPLFGGIGLVLIGIAIGAVLFGGDSGYGTNLYTEAISVGLTILVLNGLQERRDKKNRIEELKEELVRQAGSSSNDTAVSAIDILRKRGWLGRPEDSEALLKGVDLSGADLRYTDLNFADLQGTNLSRVSLVGADLWRANLKHSKLVNAILMDTVLLQANLEHTDLQGIEFADEIVLPDAKVVEYDDKRKPIYDKYWTPNTDMTRYTDPNHPDFWQPEWAKKGDS